MAETIEQTRKRLIDDGWFDKLYVPNDGTGRLCTRCHFNTNILGDCLCHEADRHMMSIKDFLGVMGKEMPPIISDVDWPEIKRSPWSEDAENEIKYE